MKNKFQIPKFKYVVFLLFLMLIIAKGGLALGSTQHQKEGRAVWISARMFSSNKQEAIPQIKKLLNEYSTIGINNLFCFNSMMEQNGNNWDFLKVLLKQAHSRKMKVHPIFMPGHRVELKGEIKQHPEWLIQGMKGEIYPYLNLANPDVREYIIRKISKALKYDIDGIHLDYPRFQVNQGFSYDKLTCETFKKKYGYSPIEVSHDCGSMIWCEWIKWNGNQVTTLVKEIKNLIKNSGENIPLSAAVFPDYETAKILIGQDWKQWIKQGIIDIICPMLYVNNVQLFENYVEEAVRVTQGTKCLVYPGIACHSSHNKNTPEGVEQEVMVARKAGADGVIFFSGYSLTEEFINKLKSTVFKDK